MHLIGKNIMVKSHFYDDHCNWAMKNHMYSDMVNVQLVERSIKTFALLAFFDKRFNKWFSISFDKKHLNIRKQAYEYILQYQKEHNCSNNDNDSLVFDFNVAGTSFRQDEINDFLNCYLNLDSYVSDHYNSSFTRIEEDYMYDEKIYKYSDIPVMHINFETEPENQHDKYAVKVLVGNTEYVQEHIGYVPAEISEQFSKVIMTNGSMSVECYINGGEYKIFHAEYDIQKGVDNYFISLKTIYTP